MKIEIAIVGLKQIAQACGCGKNTLKRWISNDHFPAFKKDGVWRAVPEEIIAWLKIERVKHQVKVERK